MARINISIPDELKSAMDGIDANWSRLAAEAFQEEVRKKQYRGENMKEAKLRMMESRAKWEKKMWDYGEVLGLEWALERAGYEELLRLERQTKRPSSIDELCRIATAEEGDLSDFCNEIGVDYRREFGDLNNEHFVGGFVKNALVAFADMTCEDDDTEAAA